MPMEIGGIRMNAKLQHAGVVFLRTFLAVVGAFQITFTRSFGREVAGAAVAGALSAAADLIAHK
jgi:hypothetical protein